MQGMFNYSDAEPAVTEKLSHYKPLVSGVVTDTEKNTYIFKAKIYQAGT